MNKFLALNLSDVVFIMLLNVKMPTIVGILTLISRIFVLSWVEHGKMFYNLGARTYNISYKRVSNEYWKVENVLFKYISCLWSFEKGRNILDFVDRISKI